MCQAAAPDAVAGLDRTLNGENQAKKVQAAAKIDDLAYLRRVTIDLIGRIPSTEEIDRYQSWPAAERRERAVDALMKHPRFTDRWSVFFNDLFRSRTGAIGGNGLTAFVYNSVKNNVPYDEMCRKLISAAGKADAVGEAGFILSDEADPYALAGITSQVFLGIRVACAQCHDHPFDAWTREQFYGLAAYFGKTRRVESRLTRIYYTTEAAESMIQWPPEDKAKGKPRNAVTPKFPFVVDITDGPRHHLARLAQLRAPKQGATGANKDANVDDLIGGSREAAAKRDKPDGPDVVQEVRLDAKKLQTTNDLYKASPDRFQLAALITSPKNRSFSRNLVNRVWADLLGRGFVEPIDDFKEANAPSHPETLDYLADEFVASGYDMRALIKLIVASEAYQRGHLKSGLSAPEQLAAEKAFTALPVRRMMSETLYDSMVQAGHLFDVKYGDGENMKTVKALVREAVVVEGTSAGKKFLTKEEKNAEKVMAMRKAAAAMPVGGYDLETALEVFDPTKVGKSDGVMVEEMKAMSKEEIEADRLMAERKGTKTGKIKYVERIVEQTIDDNPRFVSSLRMASPAPPAHFLRVFGQTSRDALGEMRDHSASMRQALMLLNGKLTHEASRVGTMEPVHELLVGNKADPEKAIRLAYLEILTREPTAVELAEGKSLLSEASSPIDGMCDLRWVLLNCHEFRFIP
jgi:hypothetical protein